MEKYLDRANISNSDVKSLERIDKNGFALKQRINEFEKFARISSENEDEEAWKLYRFIEEIYKEANNGKEPRIKIRDHFILGTKTLIIVSSLLTINIATSIISQNYGCTITIVALLPILNFIRNNALAGYDKVSREFLINPRILREELNGVEDYYHLNKNVGKESFMYGLAVHEVSHSGKATKFTPKDLESAQGLIKEVILNNEESLKFKLNSLMGKIKYYLFLKVHEKEEFDKMIRESIARWVYELFKDPNSKFFNYLGEETDELLYKVGAYIAKADPKDLMESFKDEEEIIKTINRLKQKNKYKAFN